MPKATSQNRCPSAGMRTLRPSGLRTSTSTNSGGGYPATWSRRLCRCLVALPLLHNVGCDRPNRPNGVSTQPSVEKDAGAIRKISFDAGSVPLNDKISHTFTIRNDTSSPLRITGVNKSCGCTTAELPKHDIKPGETLGVPVRVDVGRSSAKQVQTVLLNTDSPKLSQFVLSLAYQGSDGGWETTPRQVRFGRVVAGETLRRDVHLATGVASQIVSVASMEPWHSVSLRTASTNPAGASVGGGASAVITIALAADAPAGELGGSVRVKTTSKTAPELVVPVFATVERNLRLVPDAVSWGFVKAGERRESFVELHARTKRPVNVVSVDSSDPQMSVTRVAAGKADADGMRPLGQYRISLANSVPGSPGVRRLVVRFNTDDPGCPTLEMPVSFYREPQ